MMTLNPFVDNNKARINQFLNNLCEVGDFYDTLEVRMLEIYVCSDVYLLLDGPVHGAFEEGSDDPYHVE